MAETTLTRGLPTEPTVDRRRIKRLRIDPQILVDLCKHDDSPFKVTVTANALPADAKAVAIDYDVISGYASIIVQSASYDVKDPAVSLDELPPPTMTRTYDRCQERSPSPYDPLHQQCALIAGHPGEHSRTDNGWAGWHFRARTTRARGQGDPRC